MRYWLLILMVAVASPLFPLLKSNFGPAVSAFRRSVATRLASAQPRSLSSSTYPTATSTRLSTMAEAIPQQNPMPVLSEAGPADQTKAQELPKLSTEDFRIYNRLAGMMDAYVSRIV